MGYKYKKPAGMFPLVFLYLGMGSLIAHASSHSFQSSTWH